MTKRLLIHSAGVFICVGQIGRITVRLAWVGPVTAKQVFAPQNKSSYSKASLQGLRLRLHFPA
jgi:hypothetical protein